MLSGPHRLVVPLALCHVGEAVVLDVPRIDGLPGDPEAVGGLSINPQGPYAQQRSCEGYQRVTFSWAGQAVQLARPAN